MMRYLVSFVVLYGIWLALANSITLTPGTLTMDVRGEKLLIHWINVKSEETEEATGIIGGRFERFLRRIFS